ncbi:MAG TPA: nicotinate-nucleotide adenylyltransferase [Terriglobia bacterium]|nr:nicotinate-nucleotide adenylyltransferase [Terriglobia bacterium]
MNIALFGGTFDPIHAGHLRAAQAAARKFRLDQILFIPSGNPPHKLTNHLTPFYHRYSMVTLACAGEPRFVPSLLEAPTSEGRHHYSVFTTRKVKRSLGAKDHLYFLIGVDAFLDLPHWKEYRRLLDLADFIVVSRPGFSPSDIAEMVRRSQIRSGEVGPDHEIIPLRKSTLHILRGVDVPVASSQIRTAFRARRQVAGLVPPLVEEYILKEGLYRPVGIGKNR